MKIEGLFANVTPVMSPDRTERAILGMILDFFANSGRICGWGATLRCRNPLLIPNIFTWGHSMKIEWLVTDVTTVGSPDRTERAISGVSLVGRCFDQFRPYLWTRSHFVM